MNHIQVSGSCEYCGAAYSLELGDEGAFCPCCGKSSVNYSERGHGDMAPQVLCLDW